MSETTLKEFMSQQPPTHQGYVAAVLSSFGQCITLLLRQKRIIFATLICFLPIVIPLMLAMLSTSQYGEEGADIFTRISTDVYIKAICPLLSLFFATMLVGQDVESHTIPYVLTRPLPRSAWVIGRFFAYLVIASAIMGVSFALLFGACTTLEEFAIDAKNVKMMMHFWMASTFGLLGYGAFTMFLGAFSKRPIIFGVIFIYGWQSVSSYVPGYIDFLTIRKFVETMLPSTAIRAEGPTVNTQLGDFQINAIEVSAIQAGFTLVGIAIVLTIATVIAVRLREYASAHAVGG